MKLKYTVVNKFNALLIEVLNYYGFNTGYVTMGHYGLYCINLTMLGYKLGENNVEIWLRAKRLAFLVPFYLFYEGMGVFNLNENKLKQNLRTINETIKVIRYRVKT